MERTTDWTNPEGHDADAEEMILLSRLAAPNPLMDKVNARMAELGLPEIRPTPIQADFEGPEYGPAMSVDLIMDVLSDRSSTERTARMIALPQSFGVGRL